MATREDIDLMLENAQTEERIPMLQRYVQECEKIARHLSQALEGELPPRTRAKMEDLRDYALEAIEILNERIAEVEADRADPEYERRRAERLARQREAEERLEQMVERAAQAVSGFFRDLADKARNVDLAGTMAALRTPRAECPSCGASCPQGARFCPQCGEALAKTKKCSSCGKTIAASARFCPECGERQQ